MFVSRIINTIKLFPKSGKRRLADDLKKDILWWSKYVQIFDGKTVMRDLGWNPPDLIFSTDSCLTRCGGWSSGEYFHTEFPSFIMDNKEIHINELETLALIVGLKLWVHKVRNRN